MIFLTTGIVIIAKRQVEKFFTELAEILDNDRAMAKQKEAAQAVGEGKPTQQER